MAVGTWPSGDKAGGWFGAKCHTLLLPSAPSCMINTGSWHLAFLAVMPKSVLAPGVVTYMLP